MTLHIDMNIYFVPYGTVYRNEKATLSLKLQCKLYNQLRLCVILYNEAFGKVLIPTLKLTLGSFAVASIYSTIRLSGTGHPFIVLILVFYSLFSISLQFALYPMAAKVKVRSLQFTKLRDQPLDKYESALFRACIPASIAAGPFYNIDAQTPLTYVHIIINQTIGLLMI